MNSISFRLAGSGLALPTQQIPSTNVDLLIGREAGFVERTFKLENRYWASGNETSTSLGAKAAQAALDSAGWAATDIDVLIGASGVMEQPIPGNAPLIQRLLGLGSTGIPAFDVNATCLSFLMAFDTVLSGFALKKWKRALIVSSEIASAALNFKEPESSVIFGDGAVAIALEANGSSELQTLKFSTYGDGADFCTLGAGGTRLRPHDNLDEFLKHSKFQMDGPNVFRLTARHFPGFIKNLFEKTRCATEDLATIIPHQASAAALEHLKRNLPDGHEKTIDIYRDFGNQIAASMPHALHKAREEGRLIEDSLSLLIGSSAGISIGGAVIRW